VKKDIFSESKKLYRLAKIIRNNFESWNYEEIFMPFMEEYTNSFRGGLKYTDSNNFFLIKPDATSQIISRIKKADEYRCFYFNEYFPIQGECSLQFGAEFIGKNPLQQKLEILSVVFTILKSVGIEDFYIDIGSLENLNGILKEVPEFKTKILKALEKRNFSIVEDMNIDKEIKKRLWEIFSFRGKKSGIKQLDQIVEKLPEENIFIDTGTIRYLEYYEDIVFEIYSPLTGKPLGGGGDYKVGGMTGFGFFMDLKDLSKICDICVQEFRELVTGDIKETYERSRELTMNGKKVEVVL